MCYAKIEVLPDITAMLAAVEEKLNENLDGTVAFAPIGAKASRNWSRKEGTDTSQKALLPGRQVFWILLATNLRQLFRMLIYHCVSRNVSTDAQRVASYLKPSASAGAAGAAAAGAGATASASAGAAGAGAAGAGATASASAGSSAQTEFCNTRGGSAGRPPMVKTRPAGREDDVIMPMAQRNSKKTAAHALEPREV
jgi:hypothetical protein